MTNIADVFRDKLNSIKIDGTKYWIMEGDTLLDDDQLDIYAHEWRAKQEAAEALKDAGIPLKGMLAPEGELVGINTGQGMVRWAPGLELSYCVLKQTFIAEGNDGYDLAVDGMTRATKDWENTCGVRFVYKQELDEISGLNPDGVLFTVREIDANGQFIAAAFFPNDPVFRRRVLIDPSFYSPGLGFNTTGVLRHELGHVLGFRHEHIRPDAPTGCPEEELFGVVDLTEYDPKSVMHYLCGNLGDPDLQITELDKIGSQNVYGPPLNGFQFFD